MANKYSRYELQPFPSLYVDNKQPEISALLADRYDKNKTSKDLIDRTLSQLELLEGDRGHLERIKTDVKTTLKDHTSKGDWENSSLVVADAAMLVETDKGLISANKSMQNRQAEIKAIREAKINGIPMLDFGKNVRQTHESYYFDEQTGAYVTNIYEPQVTKQLDYRTRKEKMIGKIPASQYNAMMAGIGRGQTNKTASLVVDQYIQDTAEGQQEYKKIMQIDLPQSLPIEQREQAAKAQILQDFREVARQQEYNKNSGVPNQGQGGNSIAPGITITSSQDSKIITGFDKADDKISKMNKTNISLIKHLETATTDEEKDMYRLQIANNNKLLDSSLKKLANTSEEGKKAYDDYLSLTDRFRDLGEDGEILLASTQYLTLNTNDTDTDWGQIMINTGLGAVGGAASGGAIGKWGYLLGPVVGSATTGITATAGALWGAGSMLFTSLVGETAKKRNVRDWHRTQGTNEYGGPTLGIPFVDDEREQLADELYGGENPNNPAILGGPTIKHLNNQLGTNFSEDQLEEVMGLTNSYYTFMTDDKSIDADGNETTRLSGDDLFKGVNENNFTVNQKTMSYDMSADGKKKRTNANSFIQENVNLKNGGMQFEGMNTNTTEFDEWINGDATKGGVGGIDNLTIRGIMLPDIANNAPLRITFGSQKDGTRQSDRTAYITDPTMLAPGGWVHDLLRDHYGKTDAAYEEKMRMDYDRRGYGNVTLDNYTLNLAEKRVLVNGGTQEDVLRYKKTQEDYTLKAMLMQPETFNFEHYKKGPNGEFGLITGNGFIPFDLKGSFNEAAWVELSNRPQELLGLRMAMLGTSLQDFTNIGI